ncbi:MAG: L-histidine N(alpha)-methyltransferase [Candidatus Zixiibacteriota bacterium]
MSGSYKILDPRDFADSYDARHSFALEVLVGLSDSVKSLPSKYLYDTRGSELFTRITNLPEYYLTDCESEVLRTYASEIATLVQGAPFNLVELGAGTGAKTKILLEDFHKRKLDFQYVPIDISEGAMKELIEDTGSAFSKTKVNGLVADYFNGLKWLNNQNQRRNVVLFLGSSIGNFANSEAKFFLRNVWNCLSDGDVALIGFDLKKDIETLLWAYNDSKGVTAEFNLNLLKRINAELGGQFDVTKFRHYGTYNVFTGAMESFLVSMVEQKVYIDMIGRSFGFREWEPIRTEYSFKFLESDISALASDTGFDVERMLTDSQRYFIDSVWKVNKPGK